MSGRENANDINALVAKAVAGDPQAAMQLVGVVYAEKVKAAIFKYYPRYANSDCRQERDELLHQFLIHVISPDSNGNWRLRNLKAEANLEGYIYRMALNFLSDRHDMLRRRGELDVDFKEPIVAAPMEENDDISNESPEGAGFPDSYDSPVDPAELVVTRGHVMIYDDGDRRRMAIVEILNAAANLSARERYILTTNLLAKLVKPKGEALHVADNINAALHLVSDDDKNNMYESYNRFRERSQMHVYGRVRNPKSAKKKATKSHN